jgi:hypothetical protein
MEKIEVRIKPNFVDDTASIRETLDSIPPDQPFRLILEEDEYNFYEAGCSEMFCYISNNSSGLKKIAFPLIGRKHVTIDGQGALLRFHGRVCPFFIRECKDIKICNLSIEYTRPFFSQGLIEKATPEELHLRIGEDYPHEFIGGRIWFNGSHYEQRGVDNGKLFKRESFLHCLEFDSDRRETAFMAPDHFMVPANAWSELGGGLVKVSYPFSGNELKGGNTLMISHDHRDCFGVFIDASSRVNLEQMIFGHTGAMAIVAQKSEDLNLLGCTVAPDDKGGRMVSSIADASHFTSCRGRIRIDGCRFENMLDDPVNVHGIYACIRRIVDARTLEVGNGHFEQAGVCALDSGTRARFINRQTLLPLGECSIHSVRMINSYLWRIELEEPLGEGIEKGDCLESLYWVPNVEIRNCQFGKNRARGPLITTAGDVLIENNHFHHAGSAIKISGDTKDWFESGAVRNVLIQNNVFENCGYGIWGRGIIAIDPEIDTNAFRSKAFHRNIRIIGNEFRTFHEELIFARCVDGLSIQNNTVFRTDDYPKKDTNFNGLLAENCFNVDSQWPSDGTGSEIGIQ